MTPHHFVPIRRRLLVRTMALLLGVFAVMLVAVILQSLRMVTRNTETIEASIRRALIDKGIALTSNSGLALAGMVENNAITDAEQLLSSTVSTSHDVAYAIFMTKTRVPWVMASRENPAGTVVNPKTLDDPTARWAASLTALDSKETTYRDQPIIEFAAPVRSQHETLGWVRYGLSTAAMRHAQADAARDGRSDRNAFLSVVLSLATATSALAFFMARRFSDHLARRIGHIVESTRTIAEGQFDVPLVVADNSDELGALGHDVDRMRLSLKALTASLVDQERLRQEMELARRIQTALLPTSTEGLSPDLEIAALMLPADEVGGDYYDAALDREGVLWITVGDVSGHGVTPGLVMMMTETAHAAIRSGGTATPHEMVVRLNRTLYENVANRLGTDLYVTLVALRYEGTGRFTHAGAHLELLIHRRATDTVDRVTTDGMWLAVDPDISETTVTGSLELGLGDTLVLYTDGCTESRSPSGDMLNIAGMESLVRKYAHLPSKGMVEAVVRDLREWCADQPVDDITVMAVRRSA